MDKLVVEHLGLRPTMKGNEIGIEIEMEGFNLSQNLEYWRMDHDGSLRGESIEYVIAGPVNRKLVRPRLEQLQLELKYGGAELDPSPRCGVHIHINCQELTVQQTLNFAYLYYIFEDILIKYCGKQREGNLFCLPLDAADLITISLQYAQKAQTLRHLDDDNWRYAALNFNSLHRYGSLEFRAFRSTTKFMEINEWTELLLKIKDASLEYDKPYEIMEAVSMDGAETFFNKVFKEQAKALAKFAGKKLSHMVMHGARRIQDVCYTPPTEEDEMPLRREEKKLDIDFINKGIKVNKPVVNEAVELGAGIIEDLDFDEANVPGEPNPEELSEALRRYKAMAEEMEARYQAADMIDEEEECYDDECYEDDDWDVEEEEEVAF
tara:strand:- start:12155 stop:13291 length:1137 start_codon:yes stop_codon:yes gene_type:complete